MEYEITLNGYIIALPKYTVAVSSKLEDVKAALSNKALSVREKYKTVYSALVEIIDKDRVTEYVGDFEAADPNTMEMVFTQICDAYAAPLREFKGEALERKMDGISLEKIQKLADAVADIERLSKVGASINTTKKLPFSK